MNHHRIVPGETVVSFEIPKELSDAKEIAHYLNCTENLEDALLDALRLWVTHHRIVSRRLNGYIIEKTLSESQIDKNLIPNEGIRSERSPDPFETVELRDQERIVAEKKTNKYPAGFQNFLDSIQ